MTNGELPTSLHDGTPVNRLGPAERRNSSSSGADHTSAKRRVTIREVANLAQVSLGYTGAADPDSELAKLRDTLTNPFHIPEAVGALADDMRFKLMFDLGYAAALEDFWSYVRLEAWIIVKTPLIMLMSRGR